MHCWKTINLEKQFGFYRVFLLSCLTMMMVFSIIYVPIDLFFSKPLYDNHLLTFIFGLLSIYPLHKLFHLLPFIPYVKRIKCKCLRKFRILPIVSLRVDLPISKYRYVVALISPFIIINSTLLFGCIHFTHYAHYFTILLAYHTGICAIDLIYARHLMYSPKNALIEENDDGFEILIFQ